MDSELQALCDDLENEAEQQRREQIRKENEYAEAMMRVEPEYTDFDAVSGNTLAYAQHQYLAGRR